MKILSGPYGTLLEFITQDDKRLFGSMQERFQTKRGSFYPAFLPAGQDALEQIALQYCRAGCDILVTPTYRGGYSYKKDTEDARLSIQMSYAISRRIKKIADQFGLPLWGSVGPIGDSYTGVGSPFTMTDAKDKHYEHIHALLLAGVSEILFETAVKKQEIIGLIRACQQCQLPVNISFYVDDTGCIPEPDGRLTVDAMIGFLEQETGGYVTRYGINCAPKEAIRTAISRMKTVSPKFSLLYPNASHPTSCSYSTSSKEGESLDVFFADMVTLLPSLAVIGGCCGYGPEDISKIST